MAFDITSVLRSVPDAEEDRIEYIEIDRIDPDPDNFYSLEGLDELAANIELIGLQQPLRVRQGDGDHVVIVSGHRRRAACLMLRDGGNRKFDRLPCIRDRGQESAEMRELRLIYANASTRVLSPAEISRQAERVETLLYQLKAQGVEFPGRMREHVAQACKVSRSKIARLHAIRKNLVPELLERFDRGDIPEETAFQLSRLPAPTQAGVETCLMTGKKKQLPYAYQVEKVAQNLDVFTKPAPCLSHAGAPDCTVTHVHICRSLWEPYRDCNQLTPNKHGSGICCRECNDRNSCSWACKECKDRRALDKAVEKEKEQQKEQQRQREEEAKQKAFRSQRREQAQRVKRLTDELGLIDECPLPSAYSWSEGMKVQEINRIAEGRFGKDHYYNGDLLPTDTKTLKVWAEFLECSTDYLLGMSEDPTPAAKHEPVSESDTEPRWKTGRPPVSGLYVVKSGVPAEEGPQWTARRVVVWTGDSWVTNGPGVPIRENIYGWYKIPEG